MSTSFICIIYQSLDSGNAFYNKYTTSNLKTQGCLLSQLLSGNLRTGSVLVHESLFFLSTPSGKYTLLSSVQVPCQNWTLHFHWRLQKPPGGKVLSQHKLITDSRQHRAGATPLVTGTTGLIKDLSQEECQETFQKCLTKSQRSYIAINWQFKRIKTVWEGAELSVPK